MNKPLSTGSEWTFELLRDYDVEISAIAQDFQLDTYPNQIEIINSEQMLDAYASIGMPVIYNHWSFGKQFINIHQEYKRGAMGLAYEIVINSNPCIAYLMEENTMSMQALVIAHASYGHNSFFKGNYLFKTWTDAESIIDDVLGLKKYIRDCEERYGYDEVERVIDACHSVMNYGVDHYKRPETASGTVTESMQQAKEKVMQEQVNDLFDSALSYKKKKSDQKESSILEEPEENILYFLEHHAPLMEDWKRKIIHVIRKLAQYYYPQRQTKVMNEGWATFWHYQILNKLYDKGLVTDGFMMEFLSTHTNVIYQPEFDSPYFSGMNPYALGFNMMMDIKRICEHPTEEDRHWFSDIANTDWLKTLHFIMKNFKDESFILQYLSPKLMRDFRLFSLLDNTNHAYYLVNEIHNESGYRVIREQLAQQYDLSINEPNIQIYKVNMSGDRSMVMRHYRRNSIPLSQDTKAVLKHIQYLWGFDVHLESCDDQERVISRATVTKSDQ